MTVDDFREAMNLARREDRLLFLTDGEGEFIAVGLDSGRGVAIMHGGHEVRLEDLRVAG